MPIKTYPDENNVVTSTANRRVFSTSGCVNTGSSSIAGTATVIQSINTSTARGWETPGWRKIKNEGGMLPFTSWDKYHFSMRASPHNREWCASPTGQRNRWEGLYNGADAIPNSVSWLLGKADLPDYEYCVQQAAAAIYSSGMDALTFLAEIGQLRRMLSGVGTKLWKLTQGKSPGRILDLWLEARYGWRTLKYDIDDFRDYLNHVNANRTRYRESKGLKTAGSWSDYQESTSSGLITGTSTDISWSANARGTVIADIEVPGLRFNPITTAWEITRLSFVVDWLLNVGQALEAASFLLLTKQHVAGAGYRVDFDLNVSISDAGHTGSVVVHSNSGGATGNAYIIKRWSTGVGLKPNLKLRLDGYKVVDLFALIMQRLR